MSVGGRFIVGFGDGRLLAADETDEVRVRAQIVALSVHVGVRVAFVAVSLLGAIGHGVAVPIT